MKQPNLVLGIMMSLRRLWRPLIIADRMDICIQKQYMYECPSNGAPDSSYNPRITWLKKTKMKKNAHFPASALLSQ